MIPILIGFFGVFGYWAHELLFFRECVLNQKKQLSRLGFKLLWVLIIPLLSLFVFLATIFFIQTPTVCDCSVAPIDAISLSQTIVEQKTSLIKAFLFGAGFIRLVSRGSHKNEDDEESINSIEIVGKPDFMMHLKHALHQYVRR